MTPYTDLSLWLDTLDGDIADRPPLPGDVDVDVAIVGGGFTGLWTAYYLARRDPSLEIAVVEREVCGFGASGRNGGWCVGELPQGVEGYSRLSSHDAAMRLARAVFGAVDEVGRVAAAEGIDCDFEKGGVIRFARTTPQADRQRAEIEAQRRHGFTDDEMRLVAADEARALGNAADVQCGIFFAACAALHPAKLVRGLADVVERRGVRIHEHTAVTGIRQGRVDTDRGVIQAGVVIRATEGYTRDLPGERRTLVPLYSLMVATEPLDETILDEIGLSTRPTFADDRYMVVYGQRTADGRIAFGGRGVPYLFGSRIDPATERHRPSHDRIHEALLEIFPQLAGARITHRWGGVLGAPRNWTPGVRYDPATGLGTAGGYVGEGVAAANLAGQTLADLVTGTGSELTELPWVGVRSRRWEPEPIRWLGIRGTRAAMTRAEATEARTDRASRLGRVAYELLR